MRRLLFPLVLFLAFAANAAGPFRAGGPATTDNDASCDISNLPAATLLLPYFEVDLISAAGSGETTLFTVTNVTNLPQIAHVTLWTDFGYPVIAFNIYLTGYDVQSINLYDVIRRGRIAPDDGTGYDVSPVGELSGDDRIDLEFDNPLVDERSCTGLPVALPAAIVNRMQSAFATGRLPAGSGPSCNRIGRAHANAIGYATIDVISNCTTALPTELSYHASDLLFDNVLTGDYSQINGNEDFAQGGPLVHIRATPEGGSNRERLGDNDYRVNLPRTFYGRFQHPLEPTRDARQPLPSIWAGRWISGGASGFETFFKIWREGHPGDPATCAGFAANDSLPVLEVVRFDEEENPETHSSWIFPGMRHQAELPAASMANSSDERIFPPETQGAVGGWMYINLDVSATDGLATQSWVITSMRAEDRFSVDAEALALGNGCSAAVPGTAASGGKLPIGPAPNVRK